MKKNNGVQRLLDQRAELIAQMEALKHKISGLEMAIELFDTSAEVQLPDHSWELSAARPDGLSKAGAIRRLLKEAGVRGLDSRAVVDRAPALGVQLKLSSVASVLSRMKREGEVVYRDGRYRLKEFARSSSRLVDAAT